MIPRDLTRLPASEMFLNLRYGQTVFTGRRCGCGNQPVTNQFAQKRAEGGEGFARLLGDLLNFQWLPGVENGQDLPPGSGGRHAQLRIGEYIRAVIHAEKHPPGGGPAPRREDCRATPAHRGQGDRNGRVSPSRGRSLSHRSPEREDLVGAWH